MKRKLTRILALLPLCLATAGFASPFWESDVWLEPERGFLYYEPEHEMKPGSRSLEAIESVPALRTEVEKRLHAAVMHPEKETIEAYLEANRFLLEKSARFAQAWKLALWENPRYDFTVQNPGANFAQARLKEDRSRHIQEALTLLKDDWALVFVIQAGCSYCELMAPVAQYLKERFSLSILPVYLGSQEPAAWPEAKPDNGFVKRLSELSASPVEQTPAIFLVHKDGKVVKRLATGAVSAEEIIVRFVTLAKEGRKDKS